MAILGNKFGSETQDNHRDATERALGVLKVKNEQFDRAEHLTDPDWTPEEFAIMNDAWEYLSEETREKAMTTFPRLAAVILHQKDADWNSKKEARG